MIETGSYPTAGSLGEFGLIRRITAAFPPVADGRVRLGPGDDAAVIATSGQVVASVDLLVEGRHFRRDWSSAYDVGAKAAAASLADIAAMGAVPVALLVGLALPESLPADWVDGLAAGLGEEAAAAGAEVVGGDISASDRIVLSLTVLGEAAGRPVVTRAGAAPGDAVVVVGRLGWAAAGLAALTDGRVQDPSFAEVVAAHRRPVVPYAAGRRLAEAGATAMIDVSDGLLADLGHVCEASGVTVDLRAAALRPDPPVAAAADLLEADPMLWVLTGGDDHALVATLPEAALPLVEHLGIVIAGRIEAGPARVLIDGRSPETAAGGWRHF